MALYAFANIEIVFEKIFDYREKEMFKDIS